MGDGTRLGPWLRRAGPASPVELVTRDGAMAIGVADWLRLMRQGFDLFAPELRALQSAASAGGSSMKDSDRS